jgi:hypothetical protein
MNPLIKIKKITATAAAPNSKLFKAAIEEVIPTKKANRWRFHSYRPFVHLTKKTNAITGINDRPGIDVIPSAIEECWLSSTEDLTSMTANGIAMQIPCLSLGNIVLTSQPNRANSISIKQLVHIKVANGNDVSLINGLISRSGIPR